MVDTRGNKRLQLRSCRLYSVGVHHPQPRKRGSQPLQLGVLSSLFAQAFRMPLCTFVPPLLLCENPRQAAGIYVAADKSAILRSRNLRSGPCLVSASAR